MDVLSLLPNLYALHMHWFPIPDALHRDFVVHIAHHLPGLTHIVCYSGSAPGLLQQPISSQYMLLDGLKKFSGEWTCGSNVIPSPSIENTTLTHLSLTFASGGDLPFQSLTLPALRYLG